MLPSISPASAPWVAKWIRRYLDNSPAALRCLISVSVARSRRRISLSATPKPRATAQSSFAASGRGPCLRICVTSASPSRMAGGKTPRRSAVNAETRCSGAVGHDCLDRASSARLAYVASGPSSKGLPKPIRRRLAWLSLARWRSALSDETDGSTVMALLLASQAARRNASISITVGSGFSVASTWKAAA